MGNEDEGFVYSAAGPVLEGGQIKFELRASTRSIEKVEIECNSID